MMAKALFLDRDGIINVEKEYLYKIEDFEFIDGIIDLVKYYYDKEYKIFVVTNQSGIARKYYSNDDFLLLSSWMMQEFSKHDILISKVYHCPHHPSISGKCSCRKPNPGMLLEASIEFDIDMKQSLMIGDKERDIEAALNAGIIQTYLFDENGIVKKSKATKIVSKLESIWK
jgi:D-glycero-D-manno-heptose 1,7-bisphosphate phosphatase